MLACTQCVYCYIMDWLNIFMTYFGNLKNAFSNFVILFAFVSPWTGQVHRRVMPSHTMYALNMERILARLWHPSHEELEQDRVHRQRLAAKEGLLVS